MRISCGRVAAALAALVLVGVVVAPGVAAAAVTRNTITLSSAKTYVVGPSVSGRLVAWAEQPTPAAMYEIWVRRANATTKRVSTVGANVNNEQGPAVFGGRWVVWSEWADNGAGGSQWNLFSYDDSTDTVAQLTHSTTAQVMPAGNGQTVVWVARTAGGDTLMDASLPGLAYPNTVSVHPLGTLSSTCIYGSMAGYCVAPSATPLLTHYVAQDVDIHVTQGVAEDDGVNGPEMTSISNAWWAWDMIVGGNYRAFVKSHESGLTMQTPVSVTSDGQSPSVYSNCVAYSGLAAYAGGQQDVFLWEMLSGRARQVSTGGDTRFVGFQGRRVAYTQRIAATWSVKVAEYTVATDRIGGADRFVVAADAARASFGATWDDVKVVIVASGDNRAAADPLAAAGLCWKYDAPLLLVSASKMPPSTQTALQQIKAANPDAQVIVIGGTGSVPETRMTQMRAIFGAANVSRLLATGDRYDMAAAIAQRMRLDPAGRPFPAEPIALIANGADPNKFFDALSLSAVARASGNPILLVKATSVPVATVTALAAMDPQGVVVAGGGGTVSPTVYLAVGATTRWWGADRYETSKAVAQGAILNGYNVPSQIAFAAKLPDGLSGGAMVGRDRGVLLVTKGTGLSAAAGTFASGNYADIWSSTALGGTGSIYPAVLTQMNGKLNP